MRNVTAVRTPIALSIAGSDSGGGAGIQADLKTFGALGVYGASAITALTAQNTLGVRAIHEAPSAIVREQIRAVLDDLDVAVIKVGMLSSASLIETVCSAIEGCTAPLVLDPVMVAKSGDPLLHDDAVDALKQILLPRTTVLTPNVPEAARLLGEDMVSSVTDLVSQGRRLIHLGATAVVMKGGHLESQRVTDTLIASNETFVQREADRLPTKNTHGTGCTLSSAIAAWLARGATLVEAFEAAHAYTQEAIKAADELLVGGGHGPLHHFHRQWVSTQ